MPFVNSWPELVHLVSLLVRKVCLIRHLQCSNTFTQASNKISWIVSIKSVHQCSIEQSWGSGHCMCHCTKNSVPFSTGLPLSAAAARAWSEDVSCSSVTLHAASCSLTEHHCWPHSQGCLQHQQKGPILMGRSEGALPLKPDLWIHCLAMSLEQAHSASCNMTHMRSKVLETVSYDAQQSNLTHSGFPCALEQVSRISATQ